VPAMSDVSIIVKEQAQIFFGEDAAVKAATGEGSERRRIWGGGDGAHASVRRGGLLARG